MAAGWLSVSLSWQVILIAIIAWWLLLRSWERSGKLDDWDATRVFGVILMMRTSAGNKSLEVVSKPRRFWRAYGEVSLWVCWAAMLIVGLLLLLTFIAALFSPNVADPPSPSELVAIPGLNPMIPLGWGVIAFVVCLVIHEFGHGIQARAHGMRIRSFGLLMLGPLPLGAFAEPEYSEITEAPKRERQRMFAAGPATNIFAAIIIVFLMGGIAGHFVAASPGVHASGIVLDAGADDAGLQPMDVITAIDDKPVANLEEFKDVMSQHSAGDSVTLQVVRVEGQRESLLVNFSDKYDYYSELGWSAENLEAAGVAKGDPFLGVEGLAEGTAGIDRLAGPLSPRYQGGIGNLIIDIPIHALNILITPFQYQGVAIHPAQETMLAADDGWFASILGISGLLFLANLFFWLIWVNILLGFTNLIPMIPFDGGHLFKDLVHSTMAGIRSIGKRSGLWRIHPLWVEHISNKASSISSLGLLIVIISIMVMPYL